MSDQYAYEKRISPDQLQPGMYVSRLDRPWMETPFLLQGFPISTQAEIDQLRELCKFVFIDVERGSDVIASKLDTAPLRERRESHEVIDELPQAAKQIENFSTEIHRIFDYAKAGDSIQVAQLRGQVAGLVDSALRNADASMLLSRLRAKDNYTYNHALCVAVMAVALGKWLGFDREELQALALSASLFDVGKMQLPDQLLNKASKLSADERRSLRDHVEHGVAILNRSDADYRVLDVAQNHHERFNGSGYPAGKRGEEISMFAQIVGLVDTYDAMTSDRIYRSAVSHEKAVQALYEMRGKKFPADMLEQFIQCLGTYPVGSIVELSNGEIGIVIEQNGLRRLRPKVMLILDKAKQPIELFPVLNLLNELHDRNGRPLAISRTLEPGAHGVNPSEYFL